MRLSEGQIKDILDLKENLFEQIEKHQEGIKMLEQNITVLDSFLKGSSFTKASELGIKKEMPEEAEVGKKPAKEEGESTLIKRSSDGKVIARVYVTAEQITIVLDDEILISVDTPPFRTFFLDRIIGEMVKKDTVEAENQKIQKESMINYTINKDDKTNIKEIIIKNYRQKERADEIIKTAEWTLMRMLENTNK